MGLRGFLAACSILAAVLSGCAAPATYSCDERVRPEVEQVLNDICDHTGRCYVRVSDGGDIDVSVGVDEGPEHLGSHEGGRVIVRPDMLGTADLLPVVRHELGHAQGIKGHRDSDPASAMHTALDTSVHAYSPGDYAAMR